MSADGASDIKIKIFSWNVGNEMPDKEELAEWLPESSGDEFDIVVVGTQECSFKAKKKAASTDLADTSGAETEELEPEKPEIGPNLTQREIEKDAYLWDRMVSARLGKSYGLVKRVVLWQMRLSVYAKASHLRDKTIHHVQTATSATGGVGGLLGNKGGLVVKLDFGLTSLVFVSCHLAAHSHKLEQRNQNCEEIIRETGKMLGAHASFGRHRAHTYRRYPSRHPSRHPSRNPRVVHSRQNHSPKAPRPPPLSRFPPRSSCLVPRASSFFCASTSQAPGTSTWSASSITASGSETSTIAWI